MKEKKQYSAAGSAVKRKEVKVSLKEERAKVEGKRQNQ